MRMQLCWGGVDYMYRYLRCSLTRRCGMPRPTSRPAGPPVVRSELATIMVVPKRDTIVKHTDMSPPSFTGVLPVPKKNNGEMENASTKHAGGCSAAGPRAAAAAARGRREATLEELKSLPGSQVSTRGPTPTHPAPPMTKRQRLLLPSYCLLIWRVSTYLVVDVH